MLICRLQREFLEIANKTRSLLFKTTKDQSIRLGGDFIDGLIGKRVQAMAAFSDAVVLANENITQSIHACLIIGNGAQLGDRSQTASPLATLRAPQPFPAPLAFEDLPFFNPARCRNVADFLAPPRLHRTSFRYVEWRSISSAVGKVCACMHCDAEIPEDSLRMVRTSFQATGIPDYEEYYHLLPECLLGKREELVAASVIGVTNLPAAQKRRVEAVIESFANEPPREGGEASARR